MIRPLLAPYWWGRSDRRSPSAAVATRSHGPQGDVAHLLPVQSLHLLAQIAQLLAQLTQLLLHVRAIGVAVGTIPQRAAADIRDAHGRRGVPAPHPDDAPP